ncbi:MAG: intradiol ring-cleavage dioxygenase [Thiofilum sp.]|uniref:dioxygenase family protein n=1 Tax=Thiofilum sp. TaxID=2212733 RepID=UPI0025F5D5A8|nr:intradiol ring-cleavage dioxygenase [Thiofilum sp.]
MMNQLSNERRYLLKSAVALAGMGLAPTLLAQTPLPLTPSCGRGEELTLAQTEGPYFTPNTPLKHDFSADDRRGKAFILQGRVLSQSCAPQANVLIELWHADSQGYYDNEGYRLRGHVFTDAQGRFQFKTVMPGIYPGRTRHFHLKVQRRNGRVLTTQLYFPNERLNAVDGIYDSNLVMRLGNANGIVSGHYQFIVA